MTYTKQPAKLLDKQFRSYGGVPTRMREGTLWTFPDGWQMVTPKNVSFSLVTARIAQLRDRYTRGKGPLGDVRKGRAPTVRIEDLQALPHAKERMRLMSAQAGLSMRDIAVAIKAPQRTGWSERHQSWAWVGDEVAVCIRVIEGSPWITTLLWTREELWALFPRPDKGV